MTELNRYEVTVRHENGGTYLFRIWAVSEAQAEMLAIIRAEQLVESELAGPPARPLKERTK